MGRLAAAGPGHIRHVAEIQRFLVLDTQEAPMLAKRWRKRMRQIEVRACGKLQDVVTHRVGTMDDAATVHRLTAGNNVSGRGT